ncbi:profilin, required for normal timing of actin polymerization in response to thermal stress [Ascosphaera aggregata]|nr:profilin, required for normal timing of actin polymerization in response to thermal stress [Ascosphaera aggregata]
MSWQAYVDSSLVGSGNIDKAAIFDNQGASTWAASPGFTVSPSELKTIVESFNPVAEGQLKEVQTHGFHISGEKYFALRSDESSLYGKKGKEGVVIAKTKQALLIAHYPETVQPGPATNTVETLAQYLRELNY